MERGTETIPVIGKDVVELAKRLEAEYFGNWQFHVPESAEEIMDEGHVMHNALCVPYFSQKVEDRELVLVFLRHNGKPYADIAVKGDTVFHAVSDRNAPVSDTALEVIRQWAVEKNLKLEKEDAVLLSQETSGSVVHY